MSKVCFKCGADKNLSEFYRHPRMRDGHLNKCKECTKRDVTAHRDANHEKVCEYDRERAKRPERKRAVRETAKRRRDRDPAKQIVRQKTSNMIRDGKIQKQPCSRCGSSDRVQAHHERYDDPLAIRWLCFVCHREHEHEQRVSKIVRVSNPP